MIYILNPYLIGALNGMLGIRINRSPYIRSFDQRHAIFQHLLQTRFWLLQQGLKDIHQIQDNIRSIMST